MEDGGRVIRYRELDLRTDDAAVNICAAGILAGDIGKDLFHLIGIDEQEKLARRFGSNRPSFALKAHHKMRQIVRDNEIVLSPRILICSENLSLAG